MAKMGVPNAFQLHLDFTKNLLKKKCACVESRLHLQTTGLKIFFFLQYVYNTLYSNDDNGEAHKLNNYITRYIICTHPSIFTHGTTICTHYGLVIKYN